jgi:hypothetical protein
MSWSFWLGFSLTMFFNTSWLDWKFYAFVIPLIFLVAIKDYKSK